MKILKLETDGNMTQEYLLSLNEFKSSDKINCSLGCCRN